MSWIQVETDRYENGSGWILERDGIFGWIVYNEEIEDEFPDTFIVLSDLFTNPGLSVITADPATGKLPTQYLPALAINDTFVVNSQATMLSLNAQRGDIAIRTDIPGPGMFILSGDDPAFLPNWIPLTTQYPDWNNIQNKPATFPSSNHDHDSRYYTKSESDSALLQKRNTGAIPAVEVTTDATHRFVTDAEKGTWNSPPPAADWNTLSNKPVSFPPSNHDHDSRYYTKSEVDTALAGKRNNATPIPATDITVDTTHRFVTDAQITAWNAAGGGLSNPLNQDINFATGRILRVNNVPVAGWLDDGTPFYIKKFVYRLNNGVTSGSFAHGISLAGTNNRIFGFEYMVIQIPKTLGNNMLLNNFLNAKLNQADYDDTSLYVIRGNGSGTFDFVITLKFI
ncbi:hypothetical protein [Leptospira santarosai]|uniref:Uncharacterized protein n=1 Tax=Leptospira santarosai serovar Shermani str. LT 821 TaxID=758847 RepID=K8Y5R7_9LEPT|nr:hypothetical protein [Leptospira santarosai]EKT85135.2 hypothetical protein LSS_19053 [Leptospira santarosai serovar Shermani str. LT 821]EPG83744.1 hypothetical protein LEP1GSC048_0238 [Leptospira santarosai serovar Shermani str. 1342KT]